MDEERCNMFETDLEELLDFIKYKNLNREFAEWKIKRSGAKK